MSSGDADAVVLHADLHGGVRDMQGGVNKAHGAGIFDAVFYEVIEDLVDVVLRGPTTASSLARRSA